MSFFFDAFQLDTDQYRLTRDGEQVHVEPLVFDLLSLFAANPGAVLDKDLLIEKVWDGRIVSDATLASAVKSARKALGDSGGAQIFIETVRGRGFRFTAEVRSDAAPAATVATPEPHGADDPTAETAPARGGKPSLAVLPFSLLGSSDGFAGIEEAIAHDLISALARAQGITVIARGSSFRFRGADPDLAEVSRKLSVRYCLTGAVEVFGKKIGIAVELIEGATGRLVWAERLNGSVDDVHELRNNIVTCVATELEHQIQNNEALAALDLSSDRLDAWQAFHLGLRYVHRTSARDNPKAQEYFRLAIARDPGFARAHAGLSLSHFQNAFLSRGANRAEDVAAARRTAERAVELDPMDPFANFNMGRSYWLEADIDRARVWLDRAVQVSPNHAQGIYSGAIMRALSGDAEDAIRNANTAISLSPLDPLLYGMRSSLAISNIVKEDFASAVEWGELAGQTAEAHELVECIAAITNHLAGQDERARYWAEAAQRRGPHMGVSAFFAALPMNHPGGRAHMERSLRALGFQE